MGMQEVVRWRLALAAQEQAAIGLGRREPGAGLGTVSGAAALLRLAEQDSAIRFRMRWEQLMSG
jgi:hypothetical protein